MTEPYCLFEDKNNRHDDEQWPPQRRVRPDSWAVSSASSCCEDVYELVAAIRAMTRCSITKSQYVAAKSFPSVAYTHRADTELNQDERRLLRDYFTEIKTFWLEVHSNVTKIRVDLFVDSDEDLRNIKVTYCLDADADEALAFWDMIGQKLEKWASGSSEGKAMEVLNLVATNVLWRE